MIHEYFDILLDHALLLVVVANDVNFSLQFFLKLPILFLQPVALLFDLQVMLYLLIGIFVADKLLILKL